jgi:ribosome maturation protein SDO1
MVSVEKAVVAKLKKSGANFEVLVDCDNALALKEGKNVDMNDVLATDEIFDNSRKGLRASSNQMKQIFNTDNPVEIAKEIIMNGEIQITAEHKKRVIDAKRKRIIDMIHANSVDPKTGLPHPAVRIENAFAEANIHVNESETVEKQVQSIIKKLQPILPIKFETKELSVVVPHEYAQHAYSLVKSFGNITKNEWNTDGSWSGIVEIPAGLQNDFIDKVNEVTHGNADIKTKKQIY